MWRTRRNLQKKFHWNVANNCGEQQKVKISEPEKFHKFIKNIFIRTTD